MQIVLQKQYVNKPFVSSRQEPKLNIKYRTNASSSFQRTCWLKVYPELYRSARQKTANKIVYIVSLFISSRAGEKKKNTTKNMLLSNFILRLLINSKKYTTHWFWVLQEEYRKQVAKPLKKLQGLSTVLLLFPSVCQKILMKSRAYKFVTEKQAMQIYLEL